MSDIDSVLYMSDGTRTVLRFSRNELRQQIYMCKINVRIMQCIGDEKLELYYRWLTDLFIQAYKYLNQTEIKKGQNTINYKCDVKKLKSQSDITQVISGYTALKKSGHNLSGICPFHSEKHPSFIVYPESQSWYCFSCHRGGDLISFIMLVEKVEFKSALEILAGGNP